MSQMNVWGGHLAEGTARVKAPRCGAFERVWRSVWLEQSEQEGRVLGEEVKVLRGPNHVRSKGVPQGGPELHTE